MKKLIVCLVMVMTMNRLAFALDNWTEINEASDIDVVAHTIARECANQDFMIQIAYGKMIRNRMEHKRWASDIKGVVLQRKAFSCWNFIYNGEKDGQKVRSQLALKTAKDAWEISEYSGEMATHCNDTRYKEMYGIDHPEWAVDAHQMGDIWFYNDPTE